MISAGWRVTLSLIDISNCKGNYHKKIIPIVSPGLVLFKTFCGGRFGSGMFIVPGKKGQLFIRMTFARQNFFELVYMCIYLDSLLKPLSLSLFVVRFSVQIEIGILL